MGTVSCIANPLTVNFSGRWKIRLAEAGKLEENRLNWRQACNLEKQTKILMNLLVTTLSSFLQIYFVLLIVRVILSWFPNINWFDPPFSVLSQLTDPYLNLFRSIIPPLGGIDFSPMLAIFLLQIIQGVVVSMATAIAF